MKPEHHTARLCDCASHGFISFPTWHVALFDAPHLERLAGIKWRVHHAYRRDCYVVDNRSRGTLHRVVSEAVPGRVVDHISGDTMDNRDANLRVCTHAENIRNRRKIAPASSKFKGVYRSYKGWTAEVAAGSARIRKSGFKTELEAALFYDEVATSLHGAFAATNAALGLLPVGELA